jgi:DNA-binding IscR family transcriptional regulator
VNQVNHEKTDDVVWEKFSNKLTNYLDTVTLGSLIDETKTSNTEIDLDELTDYYRQN